MHRLSFPLLLGILALTGFGCTKPTPPPAPSPLVSPESRTDETPSEEPTRMADIVCPNGTVRYWYTDEWGDGLTFCHEEISVNGLPVSVRTEGNTTILSIKGFEQTVVPLGVVREDETAEEVIELFATPENKRACSVIENKNTPAGFDQYIIAGEDLEAQESCGSAKDGAFYVRTEAPRDMFYIRTGQDALFPSETWIQTLVFISAPHYGSTPEPVTLSWLNAGPLAYYEDREMGIAFDYPVRWGPILRGEERGTTDPMDITKDDCTYQRHLIFSGLGRTTIVGAVGDSEGVCEIGGRGGYFGDNANRLVEDLALHADCEEGIADVCETVKTIKGQSLWHWHYNELDYFGEIRKNVDEYAIYHKGHPMSGIVFSDERLISAHLDALDPLFTAMVKSLKLVPMK